MPPGCVNILLHYGGTFSKEGAFTYDGGEVAIFRNIDKDVMSYFYVVELAKSVGFKEGDTLFYGIPGRSLDVGIDHLIDDTSVSEMMKYSNQTNYLEVYIKHGEHEESAQPIFGERDQHEGTIQVNKGSKIKRLNKKRDKRIWSAEEENALVDILYEMNDSTWKADTSHKSGNMTHIEKELAKRFPNANIKAEPHIQSQVKKLKKMLSYILDIQQNGSGFGWDDERKMVVGDQDIFNGWAKSRNGAANLYMKPFPNYDKLCEIYANDLAKGAKAKGPGDEFELHEKHTAENINDPVQQSESAVDSHSQLQCPGSNPSHGNKSAAGRKRKFSEDDGMIMEFSSLSKSLQNLVEIETTNANAMDVIRSAYAHELEAKKETDERRKALFTVLKQFPEFTREELVKASLAIGQDDTKLNMFFTTPNEFKSEFITQVLRKVK